MRERSLELANTYGKTLFYLYVEPSLLKDVSSVSGSIDGEVECHPVECLARETEDGIRDRETAVVYIVLIVGRVQPFIVVVVDVSTGLDQHIRFENEIPLLGSDCKTFFAV